MTVTYRSLLSQSTGGILTIIKKTYIDLLPCSCMVEIVPRPMAADLRSTTFSVAIYNRHLYPIEHDKVRFTKMEYLE